MTSGGIAKLKNGSISWLGLLLAMGLWVVVEIPITWANGWLGLHSSMRWFAVLAGCVLMVGLPLLVWWRWPRLAGAKPVWRPRRKMDWLWAAGLYVLIWVIGFAVLFCLILLVGADHAKYWLIDDLQINRPGDIIVWSLYAICIAPVVEEFFYRGYLQTQLERVLPRWASVLIQAAIFSLAHAVYLLSSVWIFWFGLAVGWWRATKRSLLPIIVIHMAMNAFIVARDCPQQYQDAKLYNALGVTPEAMNTEEVREAREASHLPAEQAVPRLLAISDSPDFAAGTIAYAILQKRFGREIVPLFGQYLESDDEQRIAQVIGFLNIENITERKDDTSLLPAIRDAAQRSESSEVHVRALALFIDLHDVEGLTLLANHPKATPQIKASAQRRLDGLQQRPAEEGNGVRPE